jgi:hypothetical protein
MLQRSEPQSIPLLAKKAQVRLAGEAEEGDRRRSLVDLGTDWKLG